jgi:hypothetical protein
MSNPPQPIPIEWWDKSPPKNKPNPLTGIGKKSIGRILASNLLSIPSWEHQRPLSQVTITNLVAQLKASQDCHGVFTLVYHSNFYYIIDGQHRQEALKRLIHDPVASMSFAWHELKVYVQAFSCASEAAIVQLFTDVNNTTPLQPTDAMDKEVMKVVEQLTVVYKLGIKKADGDARTVYPYITSRDLHKKLRDCRLSTVQLQNVVGAMMELNKKYMVDYGNDPSLIPNIRQNRPKGVDDKLAKSGFYLGLDAEWDWLKILQ